MSWYGTHNSVVTTTTTRHCAAHIGIYNIQVFVRTLRNGRFFWNISSVWSWRMGWNNGIKRQFGLVRVPRDTISPFQHHSCGAPNFVCLLLLRSTARTSSLSLLLGFRVAHHHEAEAFVIPARRGHREAAAQPVHFGVSDPRVGRINEATNETDRFYI